MRRGRRRRRVQWLPVVGTEYDRGGGAALEPTENPGAIEAMFDLNLAGPVTVNAPMVVDQPPQETFVGATHDVWTESALNQTQEFGYHLTRIVGDIFVVAVNNNDQATAVGGALVTAGIMVRRVREDGLAIADGTTLSIENNSDPWIWRRTWLLGGHDAGGGLPPRPVSLQFLAALPNANTDMGTKWSTGVDQKTSRRLASEERLFFSITGLTVPLNANDTGTATIDQALRLYFLFDYRVLGRVGPVAGNRRNASR